MTNENIAQIQKDLSRLMENVQELIDRSISDSANQVKNITTEGVSMLEDVLEKCTAIKDTCVSSGKNALCKAEDCVQHKPFISLGIAALIGGIIGAVISRRDH